MNKGNKNFLARKFKDFVGFKKVLEVGCGTGQLSMYFSIGTNNEIVALDPTLESLNLADKFATENNIKNVKLVNADIFDDVLQKIILILFGLMEFSITQKIQKKLLKLQSNL